MKSSLLSRTSSGVPARGLIWRFVHALSTHAKMQGMTQFNNDGVHPLLVPGFTLPIDYDPFDRWSDHSFRHGCSDHFAPKRLTTREVAMLRFMDAITDKPQWDKKIFNEDVVQRWRKEAVEQSNSMVNEVIFDWLLAELRHKAEVHERFGFIKVLDTTSPVIKSDTLIKPDLRNQLKSAVQPLLQRPEKDWHPNSNDQVLNIVHPSLYPLVYRRTRVLPLGQTSLDNHLCTDLRSVVVPGDQTVRKSRKGGGYVVDIDNKGLWSTHFQWLPSDVSFVGPPGMDVQIRSYINNLHPVLHQSLYRIVEKLISKSVPLWNRVLFRGFYGRTLHRIEANAAEFDPPRPGPCLGFPHRWEDAGSPENDEIIKRVEEYFDQPNNPNWIHEDPDCEYSNPPKNWRDTIHDPPKKGDWREEWSPERLAEYKWFQIRKLVHPMPNKSYEEWKAAEGRDKEKVELEREFRDRGLQVIVKLASIELTPEKPRYEGGTWHLEGMQNEHIVATSIYYFDVENTTTSRIRFRQHADLDNMSLEYEQDDHGPLAEIFGVESGSLREEPAEQEIGSVATPGGRIIAFPNTLQHCVEPFELEDRAKSGHRRFLVLWLVDPHFRVMSTANVPPQQKTWWEREGKSPVNDQDGAEVQNLMSMEEAKVYRLELIKERTRFMDTVDGNCDTYNFCEH